MSVDKRLERQLAVDTLVNRGVNKGVIAHALGYANGGQRDLDTFIAGRSRDAEGRLEKLYTAFPKLRESVAAQLMGGREAPKVVPDAPAAKAAAADDAAAKQKQRERRKAVDIVLGTGATVRDVALALGFASGGGKRDVQRFVEGRSKDVEERLEKLYAAYPGLREKTAEGPDAATAVPTVAAARATARPAATAAAAPAIDQDRLDRQLAIDLLRAEGVAIKDICAALGYASATKKTLETFIEGRSRNLDERTAKLFKAFPGLRAKVDEAKERALPPTAVAAAPAPEPPAPLAVEVVTQRIHSAIGLKNKTIDVATANEILRTHVAGQPVVLSVTEVSEGSFQSFTQAGAVLGVKVCRGDEHAGTGHHYNIVAFDAKYFQKLEVKSLQLLLPYLSKANTITKRFNNSPLVFLRERFGAQREFACTTVHLQPAPSVSRLPTIISAFQKIVTTAHSASQRVRPGVEVVVGGDFNFFLNNFVAPPLSIRARTVHVVNNGPGLLPPRNKPEYLGFVAVLAPRSPAPGALRVQRLSPAVQSGTGTDHPHVVSTSL